MSDVLYLLATLCSVLSPMALLFSDGEPDRRITRALQLLFAGCVLALLAKVLP